MQSVVSVLKVQIRPNTHQARQATQATAVSAASHATELAWTRSFVTVMAALLTASCFPPLLAPCRSKSLEASAIAILISWVCEPAPPPLPPPPDVNFFSTCTTTDSNGECELISEDVPGVQLRCPSPMQADCCRSPAHRPGGARLGQHFCRWNHYAGPISQDRCETIYTRRTAPRVDSPCSGGRMKGRRRTENCRRRQGAARCRLLRRGQLWAKGGIT